MKKLIAAIIIITTFCTILSGCAQLLAKDDFQDIVKVVRITPDNSVVVTYNGHQYTLTDNESYNIAYVNIGNSVTANITRYEYSNETITFQIKNLTY